MESLKTGAVIVARYRLVERVSSDLSGIEAWDAVDQVLDRQVRVTLVTGPDAPLTMDAARRAALVADEHLTRVLDVLTDSGHSIIVTEPYTGSTLADLVEAHPLSPHAARAIIGDAATALEAAARRGVHHGALRPSAIRVHRGLVKVTGLGVDGDLVHTPGRPVGDALSRTDTVALVALLHYSLTGVLPAAGYAVPSLDPASVKPAGLQGPGEALVPPRDLDPQVQRDLDTLCVVTLGDTDDGPTTPAELVVELAPWNQEDVPVTGEVPVLVEEPVHAANGAVTRQSVLAFGSAASPSIGASMPGTPPPAGPVRRPSTGRIPRLAAGSAVVGGPAAGVEAAAAGTTSTQAAQAVSDGLGPSAATQVVAQSPQGAAAVPRQAAPPTGPTTPRADPRSTQPTAAPTVSAPKANPRPASAQASTTKSGRRLRFNPTPYVLVLMIALVGFAGYMAKETLFSGYEPAVIQASNRPSTDTDPDSTPSEGAADGASEPAQPTAPLDPPIIASGKEVTNPGDKDHPETAPLAIDGDDTTAWYSLEYKAPNIDAMNRILGYEITLQKPTTVSMVHLSTANEGGNVEIRLPDGTVLASGPLSASTPFLLESPVETDSLTIWFTEVPKTTTTTTAGDYRAHIYEIALS